MGMSYSGTGPVAGGEQGADGGSGAAGTGGEGVAGMSEWVLDLQAELQELANIEAESIGWLPLGESTYLHVGDPEGDIITVVGVPDVSMAGMNVLLVVW